MSEVKIKEEHVNENQKNLRKTLEDAIESSNISTKNKLNNLGLYLKTGSLSHILFMNEIYEMIKDKPGVIMEFGCWLGQNLILFENLRAIYEPFNKLRKVIGFDTFSGYPTENVSIDDKDGMETGYLDSSIYSTNSNYVDFLKNLMNFHEKNNVLSHITHNEIIQGDCMITVPDYLDKNNHTVIALAYFDMALVVPTKKVLSAIKPYLVKGSVLMFDEFNHPLFRGDTLAFREVMGDIDYEIRISKYMREKTIVIIK